MVLFALLFEVSFATLVYCTYVGGVYMKHLQETSSHIHVRTHVEKATNEPNK